jgi:hypothetical protein
MKSSTCNSKINRQVHFVAAVMVISGFALESVNPNFTLLPKLVGFGLILHATTGFCPMEKIMRLMPWNKEV